MHLRAAFVKLFLICTFFCYGDAERDFLAFREGQKIEFFLRKPSGDGPFPIMFLLHGHQPPEDSNGGLQLEQLGYSENFIHEGIATVSISVPGFGQSDGMRDFCGPQSQKAIAAVVEHFKKQPFVDPTKMGIYGISKGATLASMVHRYTPDLSLQILEAGWYDLTTCSALMPDYLIRIKDNIIEESGGTKKALIERSAVYNTKSIHAKTLILLGEFDDRRTLASSVALHEKLLSEDKESSLVVFPDELHVLSGAKWARILPFVRNNFSQLYGVGLSISLIMPAIHIAKIHPDTPAARCKKLHVGDVILRISPNNDDMEIDALRMAANQMVSFLIGKKGTKVRLHVQHFDQSREDIVLERG